MPDIAAHAEIKNLEGEKNMVAINNEVQQVHCCLLFLKGGKMAAINTDEKQAQHIVKGVTCPVCEKHLPYPVIVDKDTDRYNRHLRTYFGWCFECGLGSETIQFEKKSRWLIHKYQNYKLDGDGRHCHLSDGWTILNELPEPAPVITGPGGDYDIQISLAKPLIESIQQAAEAIKRASECLLKMMLNKKTL